MKCKPYSETTVESRTHLKTVKIALNIFAVLFKRRLVSALNNLDQNPHSVLEKESVAKSFSNKLEAISLVLPGCWLLISVWK